MSVMWLVRRGGKISGPISTDALREKAAAGILLPTDELSQAGQENWIPAISVRGLFQHAKGVGSLSPATEAYDRPNGPTDQQGRRVSSPPAEIKTTQLSRSPSSIVPSRVSKPPPISAPHSVADDDDDDEFLADIRDRATLRRGPPPLPVSSPRSGLVRAKDADGFTRLMDARLVSEDAIVNGPAEEVTCPGCGNDHDKDEKICPHCFREVRQARQLIWSLITFLGIGACMVLVLFGIQFLLTVELSIEVKLLLSLTVGSVITGGLLWLKRAYGL